MGWTESSPAFSDVPGNSAAVSAAAQQDKSEQSTHAVQFNSRLSQLNAHTCMQQQKTNLEKWNM